MSENSNQVVNCLAAFAVGALAGAAIALLYAPRTGRETRELIAQKTRELKDKAGDALDEGKELLLNKKAELLAAVEAGKQAMREEHAKHARS